MANWLFADAVRQAALCAADTRVNPIRANVPGIGEFSIDPARMRGNPTSYPETVNAIPESGAQREAKVLQVLDMAQASEQAASLIATPSNAREIVRALHIDDVITVDEADSEDKQLEEIEILIKNPPRLNPAYAQIEQQLAQLQPQHEQVKMSVVGQDQVPGEDQIGQGEQMAQQIEQLQQQLQETPQYLSSVPVPGDGTEDDATEAATVFSYMQRPDGRRIRRAGQEAKEGTPEWAAWTNLLLHFQEHNKAKAAQAKAQTNTKVNLTGKLTPEQQSQILSLAGIQSSPDTGQPNEFEQEVKQFSPVGEIVQRTRRKL
jgi:hypothetical protein